MTRYQFYAVMSALYFIAMGIHQEAWLTLFGSAMFAYYSVRLLFSGFPDHR